MTITDAARQEIAADLADLHEKHSSHSEFMSVLPTGAEDTDRLVAGYTVLPHVQRFADAVAMATRVQSIGTYPGHSPSLERALDLFHAVSDVDLAASISAFAIANQARFGVRYVIDRQRIWHRLDPVWRPMEDRGDNTQNHFDHDHVSFEAEAADEPDPPTPTPKPSQEDDEMFTYSTAANVDGGSIWLVVSGVAHRLHLPEDADRIDKAGVLSLGEMSAAFHGVFDHRG